jgi:hypothetical protein
MNQFERERRYELANESMMKENIYGNLLGGFKGDIGSMENNNNCKFKLKQNRKLLNQNSSKRLRCLRKNKISEKNFHYYLRPKAPENRTQYLSSLKNQNKFQQKLSKIYFNNDDKLRSKEITSKNSFEITANTKNNALNPSAFVNKENLHNDDFTGRNSNFYANDSVNYSEHLAEKSEFYFNSYPEDEFLTGSTMKIIVESITKTKNKILSNSLNLDGNQSNLYFSNKENIPCYLQSETNNIISLDKEKAKDETEKEENLVKMNFKISDFIPDLQLDFDNTLTFPTENFTNQVEFFHWRNLNKLDSELAENSTKEASNDNTPFEPRSPMCLGNLRENDYFQLQNLVEDYNENKENFRFFLLGNKKQRNCSDEYVYENKENSNKMFFYDDKKS